MVRSARRTYHGSVPVFPMRPVWPTQVNNIASEEMTMIDRLSTELDKRANGKSILAASLLYLLIVIGILPKAEALLKSESGGFGPIDLKFGYTPEEAYRMVEAYGERGRKRYAIIELTVDLLYPLVYATLLALVMTYGLRRSLRPDHPLQKAHVLPYGVVLADYAENVGIVTMLLRYPARHESVAWLTSIFTVIKWLGFGTSLIVALAGLTMTAITKVRSGNAPK